MTKEATGEVKGALSSALLLAAVGVVIVAGMILKTDDRRDLPRPGVSASPAVALPLGSAITPERPKAASTTPAAATWTEIRAEPAPSATPREAPPDPLTLRLATRAEADCERLAKSPGRWTAQLLVACKPETVDRMLELARGASSLYVLPMQVNDDACFRVCFGAYANAKQAASASDLPKALRGKEKIAAVEIAKVLP